MSGLELRAVAARRGDAVYVLDDAQYELSTIHEGYGRERGRFFQDVIDPDSGRVIFSITAEALR